MASTERGHCQTCDILRLNFEKYEKEHTARFLSLKNKIVSTDLLISKYREQTAELNSYRSKLDAAVAKIKAKDAELDVVDNKLHAERTRFQQVRDAKSALEIRCQSQKGELTRMQDSLRSLECVNKQLSSSCKEYEKQTERLQQEKRSIQTQLKEAQKVKVNKEMAAPLKEEIKNLKAELKKQKQEYEARVSQLEASTFPSVPVDGGRKIRRKRTVKQEVQRGAASLDMMFLEPSSALSYKSNFTDAPDCSSDSDSVVEVTPDHSATGSSEAIPAQNLPINKQEFNAHNDEKTVSSTSAPSEFVKHEAAGPKAADAVPVITADKSRVKEVASTGIPFRAAKEKSRTLSMSSTEDVEEVLSLMILPSQKPMISPFRPGRTPAKSPITSRNLEVAASKELHFTTDLTETSPSNCRGTAKDCTKGSVGDKPQVLPSTQKIEPVLPQPLVSSEILGEISSSSSEDEEDHKSLQGVSASVSSGQNVSMTDTNLKANITSDQQSASFPSQPENTLLEEGSSTISHDQLAKSGPTKNRALARPETATSDQASENDKNSNRVNYSAGDSIVTSKLSFSLEDAKAEPIKPKLRPAFAKKVVRRAAPVLPDLNLVSRKYPMRDSQNPSDDVDERSQDTKGPSENMEHKEDLPISKTSLSDFVENKGGECVTASVVSSSKVRRRIARLSSTTPILSNKPNQASPVPAVLICSTDKKVDDSPHALVEECVEASKEEDKKIALAEEKPEHACSTPIVTQTNTIGSNPIVSPPKSTAAASNSGLSTSIEGCSVSDLSNDQTQKSVTKTSAVCSTDEITNKGKVRKRKTKGRKQIEKPDSKGATKVLQSASERSKKIMLKEKQAGVGWEEALKGRKKINSSTANDSSSQSASMGTSPAPSLPAEPTLPACTKLEKTNVKLITSNEKQSFASLVTEGSSPNIVDGLTTKTSPHCSLKLDESAAAKSSLIAVIPTPTAKVSDVLTIKDGNRLSSELAGPLITGATKNSIAKKEPSLSPEELAPKQSECLVSDVQSCSSIDTEDRASKDACCASEKRVEISLPGLIEQSTSTSIESKTLQAGNSSDSKTLDSTNSTNLENCVLKALESSVASEPGNANSKIGGKSTADKTKGSISVVFENTTQQVVEMEPPKSLTSNLETDRLELSPTQLNTNANNSDKLSTLSNSSPVLNPRKDIQTAKTVVPSRQSPRLKQKAAAILNVSKTVKTQSVEKDAKQTLVKSGTETLRKGNSHQVTHRRSLPSSVAEEEKGSNPSEEKPTVRILRKRTKNGVADKKPYPTNKGRKVNTLSKTIVTESKKEPEISPDLLNKSSAMVTSQSVMPCNPIVSESMETRHVESSNMENNTQNLLHIQPTNVSNMATIAGSNRLSSSRSEGTPMSPSCAPIPAKLTIGNSEQELNTQPKDKDTSSNTKDATSGHIQEPSTGLSITTISTKLVGTNQCPQEALQITSGGLGEKSNSPSSPKAAQSFPIGTEVTQPDTPLSPSAPSSPTLSSPDQSPQALVIHMEPPIIPTSPTKPCNADYNAEPIEDTLKVCPIPSYASSLFSSPSDCLIKATGNLTKWNPLMRESLNTPNLTLVTSTPAAESSLKSTASDASGSMTDSLESAKPVLRQSLRLRRASEAVVENPSSHTTQFKNLQEEQQTKGCELIEDSRDIAKAVQVLNVSVQPEPSDGLNLQICTDTLDSAQSSQVIASEENLVGGTSSEDKLSVESREGSPSSKNTGIKESTEVKEIAESKESVDSKKGFTGRQSIKSHQGVESSVDVPGEENVEIEKRVVSRECEEVGHSLPSKTNTGSNKNADSKVEVVCSTEAKGKKIPEDLLGWMCARLGLANIFTRYTDGFKDCSLLNKAADVVAIRKPESKSVMPLDTIVLTSPPKLPPVPQASKVAAIVAKELATRTLYSNTPPSRQGKKGSKKSNKKKNSKKNPGKNPNKMKYVDRKKFLDPDALAAGVQASVPQRAPCPPASQSSRTLLSYNDDVLFDEPLAKKRKR